MFVFVFVFVVVCVLPRGEDSILVTLFFSKKAREYSWLEKKEVFELDEAEKEEEEEEDWDARTVVVVVVVVVVVLVVVIVVVVKSIVVVVVRFFFFFAVIFYPFENRKRETMGHGAWVHGRGGLKKKQK
jgi:predicted histidine transporter YuiF (NhaC family)